MVSRLERHVYLHRVDGHEGRPWNEFVDVAAEADNAAPPPRPFLCEQLILQRRLNAGPERVVVTLDIRIYEHILRYVTRALPSSGEEKFTVYLNPQDQTVSQSSCTR